VSGLSGVGHAATEAARPSPTPSQASPQPADHAATDAAWRSPTPNHDSIRVLRRSTREGFGSEAILRVRGGDWKSPVVGREGFCAAAAAALASGCGVRRR
jgi:hypothetical protein